MSPEVEGDLVGYFVHGEGEVWDAAPVDSEDEELAVHPRIRRRVRLHVPEKKPWQQ